MPSAPFTLLLVDDNEFVLRPLSRYLGEAGYRVLEARNGEEALGRVGAGVDLVILDVMMPGLSGIEVLERLRAAYSDDELPVIMATASSGSEQIVLAFELGANDYITKPLDFPVVKARIQSRLRSRTPRAGPLQDSKPWADEPGAVLESKYRLEARIGKGNFAEVYRATHLALDRPVAVKFLAAGGGDDAELRERFLREGRSTCRIEHPNAVSVLDFSVTSSGVPFLVTELLRGRTLDAELSSRGAMSPARCAEILLPVCDVLSEAHSLGIVHRDVKPQNVFLHRSRQGEVVKVLDFGIAKLIGDAVARRRLTVAGAGPGTPAYMAPERFSSRRSCDGRTDVYSLGVMLYKMLTGRLPFAVPGGNLVKLAMLHQFAQPEPLQALRPSLPSEVAAVVLQALEKAPEDRPSARELGERYAAAAGLEVLPPAEGGGPEEPARPVCERRPRSREGTWG